MVARSTTLTRDAGTYLGDVLRHEYHPQYCRVSGHLKNPNAVAIENFNPIGQPVKLDGEDYVLVESTDEGNAIGIVLWDKPISIPLSGVTEDLYPILVRGPAVIGYDSLPSADVAGVAFDTVAQLVAAYAALDPPIIAVRDLDPTRTQTT